MNLIAYKGQIDGSLTIEMRPLQTLPAASSSLRAPLGQQVLDGVAGFLSNPWGRGWATPMTSRLIALGGNLKSQLVQFETPSQDLSDNGWYGTGSIDATTDPVTVSGVPTGMSIYGRKFNIGDYVLWNDSTSANGLYSYEIDQVIAASGATLTLQRTPRGAPSGQAQFGSPKVAHTSQQFFQLIPHSFFDLWGGEFQVYKHLWDNMIVCAVRATTVGQDPFVLNLAAIPPTAASPGLAVGP